MRDLYFFGDSIAYGEWDEQGGWVQRLRSSADQAYISHRGPKTLIYNLGIPGDTAADILTRIEPEMAARFDPKAETLITFAVGVNDSHFVPSEQKDRFTPDEFERNIGRLIGIARKYTQKIAFVGLNPIDQPKVDPLPWNPDKAYRMERVKLFNSILEKIAGEEGMFFADIWKNWVQLDYRSLLFDGLHPNASGHRRIAEKVNPFLGTALANDTVGKD